MDLHEDPAVTTASCMSARTRNRCCRPLEPRGQKPTAG